MCRYRVVIVLIAALTVGCLQKPTLVGTWEAEVTVAGNKGAEVFTCTNDGKFVEVTRVAEARGAVLIATDKGTWKLEGDKLTVHLDDTDWQFSGGTSAGRAKAEAIFANSKQEILKEGNAHPVEIVHWIDSNTFTETSSGESRTFRRRS